MIEIDSKLAPTWWGQVNPARSFAGSRMALYQGSSNFVLILSNTFSHKITWLIYFSVAIFAKSFTSIFVPFLLLLHSLKQD